MLNAFRHHSLVHSPLSGSPCLRLYRAQRLSASQLGSPVSPNQLRFDPEVLNAFRHHSLVHLAIFLGVTVIPKMCSTPFGITAWFTRERRPIPTIKRQLVLNAFRHHSLVHLLETLLVPDTAGSAQRLSASQLGSLYALSDSASATSRAQRLSASQLGSHREP